MNPTSAPRNDLLFLAALYVAEFAFLLTALAIHRKGERTLETWIAATPGIVFLLGLAVLLAALGVVAWRLLQSRRSGSRALGLLVAMNFLTLALILVPIELALRFLSREAGDVTVFGQTTLLPRSWKRAASNNQGIVEKAAEHLSYLVYDDALGWTVGANRQGGNGLYFSSAEGLRAARQGAALAGPKRAPRVALVGDSFVFAEQVRFEDSWGHMLETRFKPAIEVLNFGVGGYGVDQAYLRFKKDVLAWRPDVVILGFPFHDLFRTLAVYPFINWPDWGIPFSKPRLVLEKGGLKVLNVPTIDPPTMFAKGTVFDLPFLEHDRGFSAHEWRSGMTDVLYSKRLLFSYVRPAPSIGPSEREEELVALNAAILRAFLDSASAAGIKPLVVFFPGKPAIERREEGEGTHAQRILKRLAVPILDTGPCIMEVGSKEAFVPGDPHYSRNGNAAVAKCIAPALEQALTQTR